MPENTVTTEQLLTALVANPKRVAALTADLTPAQLRTSPKPGEWSANDVLAHLRACADMWGGAIVTMTVEDKTTLRAINPRTWIKRTDYLDLEFEPSFRAFVVQRRELVTLLQSLPPDGWERSATVTGAGAPLLRTVHTYARWLVHHERPHVKQIERIASALRG